MPIDAGKLDKRVTIQSVTHTTDTGGNRTPVVADVCTVSAQFVTATAREFVSAQQVNSDVTHVIRIRARKGITSSHRLKFGTRILNLAGPPIDVGERGVEMLLTAIEEF